ncbi:MAG: helix-turn-helix transcriptional regulator [Nanoarchaeota archaeon]
MFNKFGVFVFSLILLLSTSFAVTINIDTQVLENVATFNMTISFSEDENYKTFSFEKPKGSFIVSAKEKSSNKEIEYSSAGDFFIIKPEETANRSFDITYQSFDLSREIVGKSAFSIYQNYNIPIETLEFSVLLIDDFGEIEEIFPRNYVISENGEISWKIANPKEDSFFLIQFSSRDTTDSNFYVILPVLIGAVLILVGVIFYLFFRKKPLARTPNKKESALNTLAQEKEEKNTDPETILEDQTFEEVIEKFLTENEQEVVMVVLENEGISQYDILNFLPQLSKSNLSKIITKLHGKRFLSRIRVGKVNKIYLGEKLSKFKKD